MPAEACPHERDGSPPPDEEALEALMGKSYVKSMARRRRDRKYSAARRERERFEDDVMAAQLIHLAESLEEAHEERRQLEEEAALLRGRLAVRDETVAFLRESIASLEASLVEASHPPGSDDDGLSELALALVERYGEGAGALVEAVKRLHTTKSFGKDRWYALSELARVPVLPPARNSGVLCEPMPYGLVLRLLPLGQHWAGWLLSQVKMFYMDRFFLHPDCPMYQVVTMLPANFEQTVLHNDLSPSRFGELVRLNSDANVLSSEARMRMWVLHTRSVTRIMQRFRTREKLSSPEYANIVESKFVPTACFLIVQFLARVAGENQWIFAHVNPPPWAVDQAAFRRLMNLLQISEQQKKYMNEVYDEMLDVIEPLGLDLKTSTADAVKTGFDSSAGLASRWTLLKNIGVASASSIRIRQAIGWYALILQHAFSMRQICLAVQESNRPLWSLELVAAIIMPYKKELAERRKE